MPADTHNRHRAKSHDALWRLFESWVEDYARANQIDPHALKTEIASGHNQLVHQLRVRQDVELFTE